MEVWEKRLTVLQLFEIARIQNERFKENFASSKKFEAWYENKGVE